MPVDESLVGRELPPTPAHRVTAERLREFAAATGGAWEEGQPAPPTFPIVLAFDAMQAFLDELGVSLHRIVHGEQRFAHERSVVPGDELTATLRVASVRSMRGSDIIRTTSAITDAGGSLVCTASATLVHSPDPGPEPASDGAEGAGA